MISCPFVCAFSFAPPLFRKSSTFLPVISSPLCFVLFFFLFLLVVASLSFLLWSVFIFFFLFFFLFSFFFVGGQVLDGHVCAGGARGAAQVRDDRHQGHAHHRQDLPQPPLWHPVSHLGHFFCLLFPRNICLQDEHDTLNSFLCLSSFLSFSCRFFLFACPFSIQLQERIFSYFHQIFELIAFEAKVTKLFLVCRRSQPRMERKRKEWSEFCLLPFTTEKGGKQGSEWLELLSAAFHNREWRGKEKIWMIRVFSLLPFATENGKKRKNLSCMQREAAQPKREEAKVNWKKKD